MFKHYFERIENVEIWPIISLIIFFLFFLGLLVYVFKISKKHIRKMKNLPFEDSDKKDNNSKQKKDKGK